LLDEVRDYAVSQADNPCQRARRPGTCRISVSGWSISPSQFGTGVAVLTFANDALNLGLDPRALPTRAW